MKAAVFDQFGEPARVLRLGEAPLPDPGAGEVRVKMVACPVNPSDLMVVRGSYAQLPQLPATPGFEGVGIVDAAGPGLLGRFLTGKRVAALNSRTGSWAEYAIVDARKAIPLSSRLPLEQAATFFVNPATAFIMTRRVLRVPQGEWLLQTAAGSVLGKMVIRLARQSGFRTINVVRRSEQARELESQGADVVLVENEGDLPERVRAATGGRGVRYAIDAVGGSTGSGAVRCLAPGGTLLVYGTLSGEPLSISPRDLIGRGARIEGFWLGHWMANQSILGKLSLVRSLTRLILSGILASEIGERFPLARVAEAVAAAERPARGGKVLIDI
jgi:NADPH:quinone reductase-like Zn-dependent oxidoreductase